MLMPRKPTIALVTVLLALSGAAYSVSGRTAIDGGATGSSVGSTDSSAKTQSGLVHTAPVNTGTAPSAKSLPAGVVTQSLPVGTNPSSVGNPNPSQGGNPAAGVGNRTGGVQTTGVNTGGGVQIQYGASNSGFSVQSTANNVSTRQYLSAWMSFGSFFMLLLALLLGLEAVRLQRWAMAGQDERPSSDGFFFVVLGLAFLAVVMGILSWMFLEGQYLPVELRNDALGRAILFTPEVLAPGLLMASVVAGGLALARFWFAGVALSLSGRGHGEGTRSPWMALGGGMIVLLNLAGSITTLVVAFWPKLLGL